MLLQNVLSNMPRPKPQIEIVKFNGHELSLKLKPKVPDKSSVLHTYTKYKNVVKEGRASFYAYTTIRNKKVYLGSYASELDAAIAIAEADKDVKDGVHDTSINGDGMVFIKAKPPVMEPVMSPFHGIDDKEASKLASPVSMPPSPLEPINIFSASNLKGRRHKTLLQSWQDAHGSPFKPTPFASTMRIPRI